MDDFLSVEACMPNLNTATIAGKVIKVEELKGKSVGLAFVVGFQKHWPSGTVFGQRPICREAVFADSP